MNRHLATPLVLVFVLGASPSLRAQAPAAPETLPQPRVILGVLVEPTPPNAEHPGVLVMQVTPDSPAAKAGINRGDVIDKIGNRDVRGIADFFRALADQKPGDKVKIDVVRDGKNQELTATLAERRSGPERPAFLGIETSELTPAAKQRLGVSVDRGVVVADVIPGTAAAKAGLERGDVITAVDGKDVTDPDDVRRAIQAAGSGKDLQLKVARGKETKELTARLEAPSIPQLPGPLGNLERRISDLEKRVDQLEKKLKEKAQ